MKYVGLSFLLVFLSSCMRQYIEPGNVEPGYPKAMLEGKQVSLIVSSQVDVRQFKKTFRRRFGSGEAFAEELAHTIENHFNIIGPQRVVSITVTPPRAEEPEAEEGPAQQDSSSQAKENPGDHRLQIRNIVISNNYRHGFLYLPNLGGSGGTTLPSSEEQCLITYDVEIIRNSDNTVVCSFKVIGKSGVGLYEFEKALMSAMKSSANHLINYIQEGKTKYESYE